VGDAQRGLDILLGRRKNLSRADERYFVSRFFRVEPRFRDGEKLAALGATSLMDLSDPLLSSVHILAASSSVGADVVVDDIPVSRTWAKTAQPNPSRLSAGEDYGLLFTAPRSRLALIRKHVSFRVIGAVRPASHGVKTYFQNKRIKPHGIFEHFA
jgi:thiamine-monophosphate kinase